jgi:hypothetical protein
VIYAIVQISINHTDKQLLRGQSGYGVFFAEVLLKIKYAGIPTATTPRAIDDSKGLSMNERTRIITPVIT